MKKLLFIPAIIIAAFVSSCSDDTESVSTTTVESFDLDSEAALESNYEDVDLIVNAGLETLDQAGRTERDEVLDCADVTVDEENKMVTIDYGDGCEGPGGRVRAGQIVITYNDHRLVPGAFRQVTFVDFSIDGVSIEGTRRIENVSESLDDNPSFRITLTGGRMTFEDETSSTRDADRTRTWIRATNPLNDTTQVEGMASGTRRDGVTYSVEILEPLVYKRACRASRVFIPVSGVKQITSGENVAIIDYGDGTCDNEVTVTINGGEPETRTINPRGRQ